MKKTYLSIDSDFWSNPDIFLEQLELLMKFALGSIPIIAVMNHQQMLDDVNLSKARKLINIDEHSDLDGVDVDWLSCATWISYVTWRGVGEYNWIRPTKYYYGSCNSGTAWDHNIDWKISSSTHINQRDINLKDYIDDCVGIGICMSPAYSNKDIIDVFKYIIRKNNIKYINGDLKEQSGECVTPSGFAIDREMILKGFGHTAELAG